MDRLLVALLTDLNEATYIPLAAAAVIFLTQLTKYLLGRFRPAATVDYGLVAMIWQLVMWALYIVAEQANATAQLQSIWEVLQSLGPVVLGLFGSTVAGQVAYQYAHSKATPGVRLSSKDIQAAAPVEAPKN